MADDTQQAQTGNGTSNVHVPADIARTHPALIDLIIHSESMNDEERQYWIDILPAMAPEQIEQLMDILKNERDQLAAIDAKYEKEIDNVGQQASIQHMENERRSKQAQLKSQEETIREEEEEKADQILKDID